jgi:hypothetical protein
MAKEPKKQEDELTPEELEEQNGEPLPDREVMSPIAFDPGPLPIEEAGGFPAEPGPGAG